VLLMGLVLAVMLVGYRLLLRRRAVAGTSGSGT